MADSFVQLNNDGPGKKIDTRTESTNGDHRQVIVIGDPTNNAAVAPVDATKGLAVDLSASGPVAITGNVTVVQPAGTQLHTIVDSGAITLSGTSSVSGTVTAVQPTGSNLHVVVDTAPTTAVTGTFFQATQPVSFSGNVTVVQPTGSNLHVVVDTAPTTPVTGTFFQATQPVSGTVTTTPPANASTNITQVGGSALSEGQKAMTASVPVVIASDQSAIPVSGTFTPSGTQNENLIQVAGVTLGATAITNYGTPPAAVAVPAVNAFITNSPAVTLASTTVTGNVTVVQPTGTNLHTVIDSGSITTVPPANASTNLTQVAGVTLGATAITAYGTAPAAANVPGVNAFITNTPAVTLASTTITGNVTVVQPTGTNLHAVIDSGTTTVTQATGTNLHTVVDSGTVTLSGTPAISGTVTANQGTPAALANRWPMVIVDSGGVNTATVDATGELAVADGDLELAQGSTTAGQLGPLMQGAVTTAAPTYTTAQTSPLSLTTAGALRTDASATTQPVSGTVTANQGTANATPWNENIAQVGGTTVSTAAAGVIKAGIVGNTGATLDAAGQNAVSPANELLVAGQFNTIPTTLTTGHISPLQLNSLGYLLTATAPLDGQKATYSAAIAGLAPAALATDIFTFYGSASKIIRVLKICVSATQTTAGDISVILISRSAVNTGGTSAAVTAVSYDTNNAAATATPLSYTANPTALGATVGNVRATKIFAPPAAATTEGSILVWNFCDVPGQAFVLRAAAQGLAINLAGVTVTGGSFNISIDWTEES
jgi:hypothetical protein